MERKRREMAAMVGRSDTVNGSDTVNDGSGNPPNDKTRFQGRGKSAAGHNSPAAGHNPSVPPLAPVQAEAQLTRIGKVMRQQNSSQGFARAQQTADRALADNRIMLNNRFVLEATLGAGGMGTVYRAKDLRKVEANDPNPYVAVKVLNDDFKHHPDAFVTLQREASRSHTLSHPNIVTVHDFDRDGDVIYMTMELLQGQGLENLIRQHKGRGLPKEQVLRIIRDLGQALAYAHQKHIVHSDLKPGNVFVTAEGTKVLDFGIARLTNQAAATDFDAGSLGALTPAYASLEMLNGAEPHPSDDVYAAAIIAYELFTGAHPYERKPADVAELERMRPAPIKGLSKQQWRVLASALRLRRQDRLDDITRFYRGLTQKSRSIKGLMIGTVAASALAAVAAYHFLAGDTVERRVAETFNQAETCFQGQDWICAQDSARAVLQLDAGHAGARDLLARSQAAIVQRRQQEQVAAFEQCLKKQDADCAGRVLQDLEQAKAAGAGELRRRLDAFMVGQAQAQLLRQAQDCLAREDFICAIARAEAALARGENAAASALRDGAIAAQRQWQHALAAREGEFQRTFAAAKACLQKKDYDCAQQQVELAAATRLHAMEVQGLAQQIGFARTEYQSNVQKAQNVLVKGRACFDKKNYSCAIANAESALEFVAEYRPALQLRREAQDAVERLKQQIIIE